MTTIKVHDFEVDLTLLKNTVIHFAIPCYGGMISEATFTGMMKWSIFAREHGLNYFVDTIFNESLIPRGRNSHAAKFLCNPHATHLMFVDADIGFEPWHIVSLIRRETELVAGLYPMKSLPIKYVVNSLPGVNIPSAELQQVSTVGTGFMLIKRSVFEKMYEHPEVTRYKQDIGLDQIGRAHV